MCTFTKASMWLMLILENTCQSFDPQIRHPSYFAGFILEGMQLPVPGQANVILAKPSPILFYPISSTQIRCELTCFPCLLFEPRPAFL